MAESAVKKSTGAVKSKQVPDSPTSQEVFLNLCYMSVQKYGVQAPPEMIDRIHDLAKQIYERSKRLEW